MYLQGPATYNTVLSMYRHILVTNGVQTTVVADMTLHGLRLWAAEMAYQADVPRDQRKYIGQWSSENTADIYTRDHRTVITNIWSTITDRLDKLYAKARDAPPEEITHEAFDTETAPPENTD